MGKSGSGKTSLLRTLSGQSMCYSGCITIHGARLDRFSESSLHNYHLNSGFLFQNHALILNLTVYENVALALRYHFSPDESSLHTQVMAALKQVNLEDFANHTPEQLSGGMARRAALARCIVLKPSLLFCDEPFAGQDPINTKQLAKLIEKTTKKLNTTTLLVTHEVDITMQLADYVYLLDSQRIIAHGTPSELMANEHDFVKTFLNARSF